VYHQLVKGVAAFVLAGGKSTRMGTDKAFLKLGGQTLLERALQLAGRVAGEVHIVGDPQKFLPFGQVIEDVYPGRGPLGGLQAALARNPGELNLMLAVDLPFVEAGFLTYLMAAADESGAIVTVPRTAGGWEPLCAVYRREFEPVAERALQKGRNKIDALFTQVESRVIGEEELVRMGFSVNMFRNLNTQEEFERAATMDEGQGRRGGE
jgi:molybdopterin-guanine dinucleotide biosynthesis protein A